MAVDPRETRYKRLYGITVADYDQMLAFQGGVCAICKRPPKTVRLSVDHHHKSGLVRGLLCMRCNRSLRESMDDGWLSAASAYVLLPPATRALGRTPQGVIGRVTTRRRKRRTKRLTSTAKTR